MIAIDQLTDEEFERHALEVLLRELGPDGLARFLRLNRSSESDYSVERERWLGDISVDGIVESVLKHRSERPAS